MSQPGCREAVEVLNFVFSSGIIWNDGHEIFARLEAGGGLAGAVADAASKFDRHDGARAVQAVAAGWPALHVEAVEQIVRWALGKLDTDDRVLVTWKGNDHHHETVTRIELRDHSMSIEFAHPPGMLTAPQGP